MVLVYKTQALVAGLIWGVVIALLFVYMADSLLKDMRADSPDEEFLNSDMASTLFKIGVPLLIVVMGTLLVGPFFGFIHETLLAQTSVLGLNPRTAYMLLVLAFSLLLDIAVFVTGTPYPVEKLAMNTWTFVALGLLLAL